MGAPATHPPIVAGMELEPVPRSAGVRSIVPADVTRRDGPGPRRRRVHLRFTPGASFLAIALPGPEPETTTGGLQPGVRSYPPIDTGAPR